MSFIFVMNVLSVIAKYIFHFSEALGVHDLDIPIPFSSYKSSSNNSCHCANSIPAPKASHLCSKLSKTLYNEEKTLTNMVNPLNIHGLKRIVNNFMVHYHGSLI